MTFEAKLRKLYDAKVATIGKSSIRSRAQAVGMNYVTLYHFERGRSPSIATAERIARWLGGGLVLAEKSPLTANVPSGIVATHKQAESA